MENELIRQTLASKGWEYIEAMIREKVVDVRLARNINKKKRYEDIAIDVLAKAKAANKMLDILRRLERIKNEKETKKEVYI